MNTGGLVTIKKYKYLFIFLILSFALTSIVSATDTNDTIYTASDLSQDTTANTQEITQQISEEKIIQDNNPQVIPENNENKQEIQNITKKDKTEKNVKTETDDDNVTVVNVTSSNFKQYFNVMSNVAYMGEGIIFTNNSLILNVNYVPNDVYTFSFDENNINFQNISLVVDGQGCNSLSNVGFKLSTNFKTLTLQNFKSTITDSYTKSDYLTLTGTNGTYIVRNVSIEVQKDFSTYVFRVEKESLIENCNLKTHLNESAVNGNLSPNLPDCVGLYVMSKSEIKNNNIEILVNDNNTGEFYYSSFAAFLGTNGIKFINNTLISTNCTGGGDYSSGLVVVSSNNLIKDNRIYVTSNTWTSGISLYRTAFKNNIIEGNYINVTSKYETTSSDNVSHAYAISLLDVKYYGGMFDIEGNHPSNNSIIRNTIVGSATQTFGIEIAGGYNNNISENNITLIGRTAMGVGVISANSIVNNNNIIVLGEHNQTEVTADYIKAKTVGLYTYHSDTGIELNNNIHSENGPGIIIESSQNIKVENNRIITEGHDYTVSLIGSNNTVTDNILEARNNRGDDSVTGRINNTVENNTYPLEQIITVSLPEKIISDIEAQINITLNDEKENPVINKKIYVQLDEQTNPVELLTDNDGFCTINYTAKTGGNKTITVSSPEEIILKESFYTKDFEVIQPIKLTPENFNTYITDGKFNDNVPANTYIDISGKFDDKRYAFNITKPLNIYSSRGDAFICFYSKQKSETGYNIPDESFLITSEGSGSNITGLYFENTMICTKDAHDVIFDNLTVYCSDDYGWGLGATSIRTSQNVTIRNSYFNTTEIVTWVSTVVFAASKNCLIENCTVVGSGMIGNLVYATTYNVEVTDEYGNSNITIRGNRIIGRYINEGVQTCYSVCVIGDNITVEDNYIENNNGYLIMSQYEDSIYQADGSSGSLIIRNNSLGPGKISVFFDPCTIVNNTFYGIVTLSTNNNTISENNIQRDAAENPYLVNEDIVHPTIVNISAPLNYIYDESTTFTVTVTDIKTNTTLNNGYLEVYSDGILYKNITLTGDTTTFTYNNSEIGEHHVRVWYYSPYDNISNSQKLHTIKTEKIQGQLVLETTDKPEIGDIVTLKVTYTLNKQRDIDTNVTFTLPGQQPITIQAVNNTAMLETRITTDYIRNLLGGREQSIKISATTNDSYVDITGLSTKLGVQKASTNIDITPAITKIGQTTITATINNKNNLTINGGNITFTDNDGKTIAVVMVKNNKATTTITYNNNGITSITATYDGTVYYNYTNKTHRITIEKLNTKISSNVNNVKYGEQVTITGKLTDENNNAITGTEIILTINDMKTTLQTNSKGEYTYKTEAKIVGTNNITVNYNGNNVYNTTTTRTTLTITKQDTALTINPITTSKYSDEIIITGTLKDKNAKTLPNTQIKLNINNKQTTATTNNQGIFTYTLTMYTVGNNILTATYDGNNNYNAITAKATFNVEKLDTNITITQVTAKKYGEKVIITGTLKDSKSNPISQATIYIQNNNQKYTTSTDKNGVYNFVLTAETIGTNTVTIIYDGNTNYSKATAKTTYTVNKLASKLTFNSINVRYGEQAIITGKLTDENNNAITGTEIILTINNNKNTIKTDKNGAYTHTFIASSVGTNNITVSYGGNVVYNPVSVKTAFTVVKQDSVLTISSVPTTVYGDNIVISGMLKDKNAKSIVNAQFNLNVNGKTVDVITDKNGAYSYTTTASSVGTNNITVSYGGNVVYNPVSVKTAFTVVKQDSVLTINGVPTTVCGDNIVISGMLKDKNGKSIVNAQFNLNVNGKTVDVFTDKNGAYSYTTTASIIGLNNITAVYDGNKNYNGITAKNTFKVTKQNTIITLNKIKASYSDNITITGKLKDKNGIVLAYQNMKLYINGNTATIKTDKNGLYSYKYHANKVGDNNIKIVYSGNTYYTYTSLNSTFKVKKLDLKLTLNKIKTVSYGEKTTIKGTFKDKNGKILGNSILKLTINGKSVKVKTNTKGVYTYKYTTKVTGTNNITVSHSGNKNYNKVTVKSTFKVTKQYLKVTVNRTAKVGYGSKIYIKGQLTDKHGKIIKNTVITININGKIIRSKTNSKGIYNHSLTTTKMGSNNITVSYPGSKNYNKITKKVTFTVIKQTVKIKTYTKQVVGTKKVRITGKLSTKDGKSVRNSKVILTINGVKKSAKTDVKGVFSVTVNSKSGKNTLIARFTGNKYYNSYVGTKKVFSIV